MQAEVLCAAPILSFFSPARTLNTSNSLVWLRAMPPPDGVEKAYGLELHLSDPVRVRRVARGGVAAKAGVRLNDALETIGGIDVRGAATDFIYALLQVRQCGKRNNCPWYDRDVDRSERCFMLLQRECEGLVSRLRCAHGPHRTLNHACASPFWCILKLQQSEGRVSMSVFPYNAT
jgi:hypothetical protein